MEEELDVDKLNSSLKQMSEDIVRGEQLRYSIKVEKKLIEKKNRQDLAFLRGAMVELIASKLLAKIHSEITLNVHSADIADHTDACITLLRRVIAAFKNDRRYLKEVESLMKYISIESDPLEYMEGVLDILNSIYAKEENLENHTNSVLETTRYAIQGVNCYVPGYTSNESKQNDEKIETEIQRLRKIQNVKKS